MTQGVNTTANATNAGAARTGRREPPNKNKNNTTGMISQPKEYRVRQPSPVMSPAAIAASTSRTAPQRGSRPCSSISTRHQASVMKISNSSIVDKPDTLKRQNNSVPKKRAAEVQAIIGSKSLRARKKSSTAEIKKRTWLKSEMMNSGWARKNMPFRLQKALCSGMEKSNGATLIRPAKTIG